MFPLHKLVSMVRESLLVLSETAAVISPAEQTQATVASIASLVPALKAKGFAVTVIDDIREAQPGVPDRGLVIAAISNPAVADGRLQRFVDEQDVPLLLCGPPDGDVNHDVLTLLHAGADYQVLPLPDVERFNWRVSRCINAAQCAGVRAEQVYRQADMRDAVEVQHRLLPPTAGSIGDMSFAHFVLPVLDLSGDFVDYFELTETKTVFLIADVSGHGTPGGMVTAALKTMISSLRAMPEAVPSMMLSRLNEWVGDLGLAQYVTLFLAVYDSEQSVLRFANAGHFPAPLLLTDADTQALEGEGVPLGLRAASVYQDQTVYGLVAFQIVLFSDGVLETMDPMTVAQKEETLARLVRCTSGDLDALVGKLGLAGSPQRWPDDIAVMSVGRAAG